MTKQRRLRPSQGGKMDRTSGPAGGMDPSDVPDDVEAAGDVHVASRRQFAALRDWGGFIDPKDVKHAEFHRVDWSAPPADDVIPPLAAERMREAIATLDAQEAPPPPFMVKGRQIGATCLAAGLPMPHQIDEEHECKVSDERMAEIQKAALAYLDEDPFTLRRDTPSGPVICGYEKLDDACRALAFHSDQGDTRPLFVVDRSGAIYATSRVWNG